MSKQRIPYTGKPRCTAAEPDAETPVFHGRRVAVIGGGKHGYGFGAHSTTLRSPERAIIVYRRSEDEMPARTEEVKHAKQEGIEFLTLA